MSDWDTDPSNQSSALREICEEYRTLAERKEQIDSRMSILADKILAEFVEQAGEQTMTVDNSITVTVNRPERWTWDSDIIEDLFPSDGEIPAHVTKRMTVDKRKFQGLDDDDKKILLPALTRKPGAAKITVTENN